MLLPCDPEWPPALGAPALTHCSPQVTCSLQNVTAATAPLHPANLAHEDRLVSAPCARDPAGTWGVGMCVHRYVCMQICMYVCVRVAWGTQASPLLAPQNCSNTWCQAVTCELAPLEKGAEVSVQLLRVIHNDFFRRVRAQRQGRVQARNPRSCLLHSCMAGAGYRDCS